MMLFLLRCSFVTQVYFSQLTGSKPYETDKLSNVGIAKA